MNLKNFLILVLTILIAGILFANIEKIFSEFLRYLPAVIAIAVLGKLFSKRQP